MIDKFNADGIAQNFAGIGKSSLDGSATAPAGRAFGVLGFFGTGCSVPTSPSTTPPSTRAGSTSARPAARSTPSTPTAATSGRCPARRSLPAASQWTPPGTSGPSTNGQNKKRSSSPAAAAPRPRSTRSRSRQTSVPCRPGIDQAGNNLYVADSDCSVPWRREVRRRDLRLDPHHRQDSGDRGRPVEPHRPRLRDRQRHPSLTPSRSSTPPAPRSRAAPSASELLGDARGIAYNPTLDRVYVSDHATDTVKVFGPVTTGTVPDVTSRPTTAITRTTATAHATINPLGLNHTYHFEWAKGGNEVQHLAGATPHRGPSKSAPAAAARSSPTRCPSTSPRRRCRAPWRGWGRSAPATWRSAARRPTGPEGDRASTTSPSPGRWAGRTSSS